MIDAEWLDGLRFETEEGVKIVGLLGVGTEKVLFRGIAPDGHEVAVVTRHHLLGYHIKEIPPQLLREPTYHAARLNRKLSQLVGEPGLDEMTNGWHKLFSFLIKGILDCGLDTFASIPRASPEAFPLTDSLPLVIYSSPIRRRLVELANLGDKGGSIVTVNMPFFPICELRSTLVRDARSALDALDRGPQLAHLEANPLFTWGSAAMEGFFDREREQAAIEFLKTKYGPFPGSPDTVRLLYEVDALANVFAFFFDSPEAQQAIIRFTSLCARSGLAFDVQTKNGTLIANGLSIAMSD